MLVKDFITKELPVLKSFDTGEYALALMDDFKLKTSTVAKRRDIPLPGFGKGSTGYA